VVHQPVSHARFVNVPRLGVIEFERLVRPVAVSPFTKLIMKGDDTVQKMDRELGYIRTSPLPAQKLLPRNEQVFHRNDRIKRMARPDYSLSLSLDSAPILQRIKEGYLLWLGIVQHIPKAARYTIGTRIEERWLDLLEATYTSYFSGKIGKEEKLSSCILISDTLKFFISVAWEGKLISHKQYENVALNLSEIGKMLGGWRKSLGNPDKKNRTL
jgi:hypothetical protein